mgnify:CR=1 FL=1
MIMNEEDSKEQSEQRNSEAKLKEFRSEHNESVRDKITPPKRYNSKESESKWSKFWLDNNIYKFNTTNRQI